VDWDDALPEPILSSWGELTSQSSVVQNLKFPQFVLQPRSSVELHGFCDASISAYGACLYLRSETNEESKVHLLCAKLRVAPLKSLTIPRLELSAALLWIELIVNIGSHRFRLHLSLLVGLLYCHLRGSLMFSYQTESRKFRR